MGTTRNFYATTRLHANVLQSNILHHNTWIVKGSNKKQGKVDGENRSHN